MDDSAAALWLEAAIEQAEKSWDEGGIPIGSALVDEHGRIVARGHNRRVQDGDPTAHAEVSCIRAAGRRDDFHRCTLVSTLSPCIMCSGTALLLRIPRVIAGENSSFVGAEDLLVARGVELRVMNDARCIALMERLMREKPGLWSEDIGRPPDGR